MLAIARQYGGTLAGGLALGGVIGFGASWVADKQSSLQTNKESVAKNIEQSLKLPPRMKSPDNVVAERLKKWQEKWRAGIDKSEDPSWHLKKPHPQLKKHLAKLLPDDTPGQQILFPLCGASVDLGHLARLGHHCFGVDGVPEAIDQLLKDWGEEIPSGSDLAPGETRFRVATPGWWQNMASQQMSKADGRLGGDGGPGKTGLPPYEPAPFLFGIQCDFLDFGAAAAGKFGLGDFGAAFDRGGLVAVAPADRPKYAANLAALLKPGARLMLVAVEHEPKEFGPPHSLDEREVHKLLGGAFDIKLLERENRMKVEPVWKERGATSFDEVTYLCTRRK